MSICPSKDIHSIYLDNELPPAYLGEYEAHIKSCPKCAAELAKLRAIRDMLRSDAASVTPDMHYLEQSWERLQSRRSYADVTRRIHKFPAVSEQFKYILPAAAAAAVLAVVLPFRLGRNAAGAAQTASVTPIARRKTVSLAKGNVVVSGTLAPSAVMHASSGSQNVSYGENAIDPQLNDVDVFRPDFDEKQTISIRITIPGIESRNFTTDIQLPVGQPAGSIK